MSIICLDFESYWHSKDYTLSRIGPIEYIRDERFDPFMVSLGIDSAPVFVAANLPEYPAQVKTALENFINPELDVVIGHNLVGFDALILSEHFNVHPKHMWDTILIARWVGLAAICPESHAAITDKLGTGKKEAGTVVSDGKHWPQDFTSEEQKFFTQYCVDDTAQMRMNLAKMLPYCTDDCLRFMSLTARMATEPVFILDEALLEEYIRQLDAEADEARRNLMQIFHFSSLPEFFTALRSADKFAGMLRELGVEPPMKLSEAKTATAIAKAEAVGNITEVERLKREGVMTYAFAKNDVDFLTLLEHEDARVRLLVETKLEHGSSVLRTRAETLLKYARHGKPLPVMLSAFKAHTGRYSAGVSEGKSDSIQMQNLPKRNAAYLPLRKAIKAPEGYSVVAVDSSQIECRVNAWMAGQCDLLDHFRNGRDPYAELAACFDGRYTAEQIHDGAKSGDKQCKALRNISKLITLGCGYGTSANRAAHIMWANNTRLARDFADHAVRVSEYHGIYRAANARIVHFWKVCQQVIEALTLGCSGSFGGPNNDTFKYGVMPIVGRADWAVPTIMLPNGYGLRYPNLRTIEGERKVEYVYDRIIGKNAVQTRLYGARLDENLCQALAFACLEFQACRMDENGIPIAGNNHDCWYNVVPDVDAEDMKNRMIWHMRQAPPWAPGLPLDAEGWIGRTFEGC